MESHRRCRHCHRNFRYRPQNPRQEYCSAKECQRARKHAYQCRKLAEDEEYRENQRRAQREWREKNREYWREYRLRNSGYRARNREQQQVRNRRQRQKSTPQSVAKMVSSTVEKGIFSGRYQLIPVNDGVGEMVAKMDALIVDINVIT